MKEDDQIVDELLERAHYLHALDDIKSRAADSSADLEGQDSQSLLRQKDEEIQNLQRLIESLRLGLDTMTLTLKHNQKQISELSVLVESLRSELASYKSQAGRFSKETYGSKSLSRRSKTPIKKTREEERDEWTSKDKDSNDGDIPPTGASSTSESINPTKVKSENLGKRAARGVKYTRMNAAKVVYLETSLDNPPENMVFKGYREVEEYTRKSYVECTVFKVAIYENQLGEIREYYCPTDPSDKRRPRLNVIPSTHCTPEFLSDLVIERFMMFVPYYREQIRHLLDRFSISKNTNRNWVNKGAELLKPILHSLKKRLLATKSYLNIDETWTRVRIKFKADGTKLGKYCKKYVWVLVNKAAGITYYFYDNEENDSRGKRPIENFIGDYIGSIHSDGYVVYRHLGIPEANLVHIMCWAHVRNKFQQAFLFCKDVKAEWFVQQIGELYRIEAECRILHMDAEQIKKRRNEPDVDKILSQLHKECQELLSDERKPQNSKMMNKALEYMSNNWDDLVKYRHDGRYSIDNMAVERAIRPFTVSRKNSLHFSSEEGVDVAMTYHTLIETCKNIGLNVKTYFDYVFKCLRDDRNYDPDKLIPSVVLKEMNA